MNYQFVFTNWFNRNLKALGKHNPALRREFEAFLTSFDADAHPVIPNTNGARKARMSAKGRGKRGGYRVIYYLAFADSVWLIIIYDKMQKEDLSPSEIAEISELVQAIHADDSAN